ncbi:UNVERIFIED_CONTAM: hypothetical protein PYX00_006497 [Menopon gallinae]|uniref:Cilia- and flagella-associated protein 263 n=1 Tax=Menopon gallinae TaxID=328185 RepID=A0AAW2HXE7_9NEOP
MGPKKGIKTSKWQPLPDNASTLQVPVVYGFDDYSMKPEDLPRNELENCIKFIEQSNKTLEVENVVIERYLDRMDPGILTRPEGYAEGMAQKLDKVRASSVLLVSGSSSINKGDDSNLTQKLRKSTSQSTVANKMQMMILAEKAPKVQLSHKIEIVNREIEELRGFLDKIRSKNRKDHYIYKCRHEELTTRLQEIVEFQDYFEKKFLAEAIDPLTGKLPGEKFMRYLENKATAEEKEIDKMRMKTSSTKNQLKRIQQQLAQKKELGEVLHAVDFEQLKIENRECQDKLDEKITHLLEMKKIHGRCGTVLNFSIKKLQEQVARLNSLQKSIEVKQKLIDQLQQDEDKVNKEVNTAQRHIAKIKGLMSSYSVPDAFDYIVLKAELYEYTKDIKTYDRKLKLRDLEIAGQAAKLRAKIDPGLQLVRAKSSKKLHSN